MIPNSHPEYILRDIATRDDADIDLAEGALALAALHRPCVETGWYKAHIQQLSDEVNNALARGEESAKQIESALQSVYADGAIQARTLATKIPSTGARVVA